MYKVSIKVNNIKAKNLNKYFHTTNRHIEISLVDTQLHSSTSFLIQKMQIKTIMQYHLNDNSKRTKIKIIDKTKC